MTKETALTVSVVVPCFNEAGQVEACLRALSRQNIQPLEIIVVDNNCTDNTVKLARRFKRVRVVRESKQGLIAARNRGLAAARGDILARIDADTRVRPDWVDRIQDHFKTAEIQAITGTGFFYDAPFRRFVKAYRNFFAVWLNRLAMGHHMLWGSNMAVRRSAWQKLHVKLCNQPEIMEDLDIAMHIADCYGSKAIAYRADLWADISARRAMVSLRRNWGYLKMWPLTLSLHGRQRRLLLWPAVVILLTTMRLAPVVTRFYNASENRMIFSLKQWRSKPLYTRPNP